MLKRAFEMKGYHVYEAEDGQQALEMARRYQPSLMVVDLNMPVLDGLEMIKNFRQLEGEWRARPDRCHHCLRRLRHGRGRARKWLQSLSQQAPRSGRTGSHAEGSGLHCLSKVAYKIPYS